MARRFKDFKIQELITNIEQFKDKKCLAGVSIAEYLEGESWFQWNLNSASYQLVLETPERPIWMFGFFLYDIQSPFFLPAIFRRLFPGVPFQFSDAMLKILTKHRNACCCMPGATLEGMEDVDNQYRHYPDAVIVSDEYLRKAKE